MKQSINNIICICLYFTFPAFILIVAYSWGILIYENLYALNAIAGGTLQSTIYNVRCRLIFAAMIRENYKVRGGAVLVSALYKVFFVLLPKSEINDFWWNRTICDVTRLIWSMFKLYSSLPNLCTLVIYTVPENIRTRREMEARIHLNFLAADPMGCGDDPDPAMAVFHNWLVGLWFSRHHFSWSWASRFVGWSHYSYGHSP